MSILPPDAVSDADYYLGARDDAIAHTIMAEVPVILSLPSKKNKQQTPQQAIDEFWTKFTTKAPGKATTVIPSNEYAERVARRSSKAVGTTTQASYDEAAAVCKAKVAKIVKECRRVNQKYRDPHFDLELDLKWGDSDTLESLCNTKGERKSNSGFHPKSVKRVTDIFDVPKFYIDGPTANDVRQGRDGDCWLLAALCTLSNKPSLIERVCVARDEQVGVYGFVFHRDGEWISEIIDDKLFLTKPDFDESVLERMLWEDRERVDSEEQYRKAYQSGSGALYFAQCEHANETWLPLLEKAYAKAHGDYQAIEGGFTGEGIEDLTGGVTTELYTTDILDKEYFWREELMKVNDQFLFGCSTGMWRPVWGERKGIVELHAYSVMRAVEMDGQRLVLLKNPWGKYEWTGPWSDGSKEWTADWLKKLDHRFGDDGNFWISYDDLLRKYQAFDRTRLFGDDWKVTQIWTTVSVPWTLDYHDSYFAFSLAKTGPVVLVLSQLDDRYYRGLEGQYRFELNVRLHKKGQEDYVVRSIAPYRHTRSINVELELEAGEYTVLMKVNATRDLDILPIEEVIRNYARDRRDKLVAVGMYDLAHSKGKLTETEEEKQAKKAAEKRKKDKERQDLKKKIMEARRDRYYMEVKQVNKRKEKKEKAKAKLQAKKATKATNKLAAKDEVKDVPEPPKSPDQTSSSETEKHVWTVEPTASAEAPEASGDVPDSKPDAETTASAESEKKDDGELSSKESETKEGSSSEAKPDAPEVADQTTAEEQKIPEEETEEDTSDESEVSSVSDISERELDIRFRERADTPAPPPPPGPAAATEEEDEFESNPWNAVATVGLRVYYKVAEGDKEKEIVKLRVVRPNPYARKDKERGDDEKNKGEGEKEEGNDAEGEKKSKGLDVDDSSKDATLEGDREQRKKSILSLVSP
ncbi:hypothetical protein E0Z10_g18 [Xylaria hypoxylon]|uniref:Calpain catalytic domain-containing protein n=1 Tax=Xylaria hypoxylon TaxID=37992 RepID=A0A4Z0ZAM1_9PEZI|nr:hypothetical protein E0Z10_g18 [Xylaria hypoxylon]